MDMAVLRNAHVYNVPDHLIVFIRFYRLDALHFSGMILVDIFAI